MKSKLTKLGLENLETRLSLSVASTMVGEVVGGSPVVGESSTLPALANVQSLTFTTPDSTVTDSDVKSDRVIGKPNAPASNPAFPAGFDTFTPPMQLAKNSDKSPILTTWTQTGTRNESLAITGERFTADTTFVAWGQTNGSNGVLAELKVQHVDSQTATVTLSEKLPSSSVYLLWAKNADGYSDPVAINRTEAWWVGPDTATAGETISVYGRNLASGVAGQTSWAYITQKGSSSGTWVKATSANPYKIDVKVPAGLAAGTYEVWVHNGHGGEYGWSAPVSMTVKATTSWSDNIYNVKMFGAKGDGIANDQAAIQATLTAAYEASRVKPNVTVYIPAGTYIVNQGFDVTPNLRIVGEGKGKTIIKLKSSPTEGPNTGTPYEALFRIVSRNNVEISNLTIDANYSLKASTGTVIYARYNTNLRFSNVQVLSQNYQCLDINASRLVFLERCDLVGTGAFMGVASQVFFDQSNFYGTNDSNSILHCWGGREVSITNCTAQDFDNSNPNSGAGWSSGRFFVGNGNWGSEANIYFGGNSTINLGVRSKGVDQNSGEQILWECYETRWQGTPASATASTIMFDAPGATKGYLTVMSGTGLGQIRLIKSYDAASKTFTLDTPWTVAPDSTSSVAIGDMVKNVAVYGNNFSGRKDQATSAANTASAGVEIFGSGSDVIVDSNSFKDIRYPISHWSNYQWSTRSSPSFHNMVVNNRMDTGVYGVLISSFVNSGMIGTIIRENSINGFVKADIGLNGLNTTAFVSTVLEHNISSNSYIGILELPSTKYGAKATLIRGNTFDRGTAPLLGSAATKLNTSYGSILIGNTWSNYEVKYVTSSPEATPYFGHRALQVGIVEGETGKVMVDLRNTGTTAITYSLSDDATWLQPFFPVGTLAAEQEGGVSLFVDATQLKAGNYETVVTVTANGQSRTMKLKLVVSAPAAPALDTTLVRPPAGTRVQLLPSTPIAPTTPTEPEVLPKLPTTVVTETVTPIVDVPTTVVRPPTVTYLPQNTPGDTSTVVATTAPKTSAFDWTLFGNAKGAAFLNKVLYNFSVREDDTYNAWQSTLTPGQTTFTRADMLRLFALTSPKV